MMDWVSFLVGVMLGATFGWGVAYRLAYQNASGWYRHALRESVDRIAKRDRGEEI